MKNIISPKQISYIAIVCLLLILGAQTYLVYDYFQSIQNGLERESDDILKNAYRQDLGRRNKIFQQLSGFEHDIVPPPPTKENSTFIDLSKSKTEDKTITGILDLAINTLVSDSVPIDIQKLDSISGKILQSREIHSKYVIQFVDSTASNIFEQSKKGMHKSLFTISSKMLIIDLEQKQSLQLVLTNPFGLIFKRMGLMLLSSLVFSIICLLAFRVILKILARQKQLVVFKNEFLSTIAHELKRPVASLTFNLDCMTLPAIGQNPQKQSLLIQNSMNATTELNATINMIVALAKLEEGLLKLNKETIDLKQLFEELKNRFSHLTNKRVEIKTQYESNELSCSGDLNLLTQCFANLIDNAIKYSDNEVMVVIKISKSDSWLVVSISDNGYGIPEEKLPVIFDRYARAHTEDNKINGFGIGLNYVKSIVETHHGKVAVKSQIGKGSEFNVLLPE